MNKDQTKWITNQNPEPALPDSGEKGQWEDKGETVDNTEKKEL